MMRITLSQRIVHLDLKGAPLKVSYLEKLLTTIKPWGVTGILIEWEDTFPYTGDLVEIGSLSNAGGDNMYSLKEVQHIIQFIKDQGMEPIQLIQTIGHMEFVLKHPTFAELQELPRSPAVLCPTKPRSQELVRQMIDQALEVQPDAKFFHIGADEVWHLGICAQCQERALNHKHKATSLYLDHIRDLVSYIKGKRPDITLLMWDDMFRGLDLEILQEYKLGESVIPVLWNYNPEASFSIHPKIMAIYGQLFPKMWFGTAFKGANGSCQVLSPTSRYVSNHQAWVATIHANSDRINFCGAILTGWSRYDHYATLCELMPVSLPSLAQCLRVLTKAEGLNIGIEHRTLGPYHPQSFRRLMYIQLTNRTPETDHALNEILPPAEWPGEQLGRCVHTYFIARERCLALLSSDLVNTWMNPWQLSRQYTVPGHVEGIVVAAEHSWTELQVIRADMTTYLSEITGERSTEEWVKSYIDPLITKITKLGERARARLLCDPSVRPIAPE
ncbi:hypothetical protein PYW07_016899 [Mythimna separata]|uniref:beta-N-acetylhexosaminidase n=1 Tax=Mythimna separata TaxID=271217 RepID=A0AAD8DXW3_MYTSE|nr:hypothetical protein PYW07_016899 [Mythimna separata]